MSIADDVLEIKEYRDQLKHILNKCALVSLLTEKHHGCEIILYVFRDKSRLVNINDKLHKVKDK